VLAKSLVRVGTLEVRVRAAAGRHMRDDDGVHVASGASDLDLMDGAVLVIGMTVSLHALSARQDEHLLSLGTVQEYGKRLGHVRDVARHVISSHSLGKRER
jgi:hypothetical protein